MFYGIELRIPQQQVVAEALSRDVWIYPAGSGPVPSAVMVAPPFVVTDDELDHMVTTLESIARRRDGEVRQAVAVASSFCSAGSPACSDDSSDSSGNGGNVRRCPAQTRHPVETPAPAASSAVTTPANGTGNDHACTDHRGLAGQQAGKP